MLQELANLTLPLVIQEIEDVLDEYPKHPYQAAFAMPELYQELVAYVLSHVPNRYVVKGEQELSSDPRVHNPFPSQERLRVEVAVRAGILHILRENANWLSLRLPQNSGRG